MNKWTLSLLLTALCTLPAAAQVNHQGDANRAQAALYTHLERAVAQQIQPVENDKTPLDTDELIEAEEELALLRNRVDSNATFAKYPYLLDPSYRRTHNALGEMQPVTTRSPKTQPEQEPLSCQEQIEAEEELALLRNRIDSNATFEKYPYLLNPTYRRATDTEKQNIRRPYTQPTWAHKIGF